MCLLFQEGFSLSMTRSDSLPVRVHFPTKHLSPPWMGSLGSVRCLAQYVLSKSLAHKQQEQHLWQELSAIRPRFVHMKVSWSNQCGVRKGPEQGPHLLDLSLTYSALCKINMQISLLSSY